MRPRRSQALSAGATWVELNSLLPNALQGGCDALGLALEPRHEELLLTYLELLLKWNGTYNLTAVRAPEDMVTRHLLDSLAITPHISGHKLIDVGTGAGLPGIPLAILFPERRVDLLDSNGKKARFLFQVKTALRLDNMEVHQARVESFQPPEPYDAVLSRAFASLADMVAGCRHLLAPSGCFLAMKGAHPAAELAEVDSSYTVSAIHTLAVPGLNEQRHLVELKDQNCGEVH